MRATKIAYPTPKNNIQAEQLLVTIKRINRFYSDRLTASRIGGLPSQEKLKEIHISLEQNRDIIYNNGILTVPVNFKEDNLNEIFAA